jgi:putative chitobiose transport system permease protein
MATTTPARRRRPRAHGPGLTVLAGLIALLFALPLLWLGVNSLRQSNDFVRYLSPLSWKTIVPTDATLANYGHLLHSSFARTVGNSLFVSAVTVVMGVVVCSLAAFGLAAFRFRGQGPLFGVIVLSFLIPFDAIAIPLRRCFVTGTSITPTRGSSCRESATA